MAGQDATLQLKPGDIFLTRGLGTISKLIRFFSRSSGETSTRVNHVGVVVAGGTFAEAIIVEAVSTVKRRLFWVAYGPPKKDAVAIFRPKNLTAEEIALVVNKAESYVGRTYGYSKIAAHVGDWLLGGAYFFRRLAGMDNYPICSWLVAHAYKAAGKYFGVAPGAAQPDDIWDFCVANPDKYEIVRDLSPLGA